jgi:hypothetical protein
MENRDIELFIKDFLKEIREDNAAIFAGAGLSVNRTVKLSQMTE